MVRQEFKRPSLEASVLLAFFKGEEDRAPIVRDIIAAFQRGEIALVASTLLRVEVNGKASQQAHAKIDAFFDSPGIRWVDLGPLESADARDLARKYGLKAADAVHLHAAVAGEADVLLTYDDDLLRISEHEGLRISEPYWTGARPLTFAEEGDAAAS